MKNNLAVQVFLATLKIKLNLKAIFSMKYNIVLYNLYSISIMLLVKGGIILNIEKNNKLIKTMEAAGTKVC